MSIMHNYYRCEELRAKRADVLSYSDEELVEIQSLVHDEYVKIIQEKSDLEMEILRQQVAAEERKLTQFMSGHKENVQRKRDYMYQQHEDRIHSIDVDTTKTIGSLKQKAAKDRQQHKLLIKKNQDAHQREVEKMEQELFGIRKKTEEMSSKYRQQVKEHDLQVQQCIEDRDRVFQKQETELAHKMSKETLDFKAELKKEQEEFKKQMEKERLALEEEFKAECQSELILTKEDGTVLEMREKTPGIVSRIAEQLMRD